MSSVFYDNIIDLNKVEKAFKKHKLTVEEKEEMWKIVDEMVHHRVVGCILEKLPREHHKEFMDKFSEKPHDMAHWDYLKDRITGDVELFIKDELKLLADEVHGLITKKLQ